MSANGLLSKWTEGAVVLRLKRALTGIASRPIWWEIAGERPAGLDYSTASRTCSFVRHAGFQRRTCQRRFLQALAQVRARKGPVQFVCPIQQYAACVPVVRDQGVEGYLAVCHSDRSFPASLLEVGAAALETAVREKEQAEELKTLSDSIQPRCVALSTIHTVHRLIASTLDLEELLPRVARLCCQVLRAQSCGIWLQERGKGRLIPEAMVVMEGDRLVSGPLRVGRGIAARVAATCKARLTSRVMAVPLVEEECVGVIVASRLGKSPAFGALDQEILTTLAEQAVVAIRNAQMYESQERVTWGTIRSLSAILDGMDPHAPVGPGPSRRKVLADVALRIAEELRVPTALQRSVQYAALLHDAGRLGIPAEILRKPTKLEPAELALVREHTVKGASLLEPLEVLEPAIPIILYHHERYDGTGYPKGLRREAIPLGARILAVANAFEAMLCDRPYRKAMTAEQAAREISSHSGTQFDPKVVEAFLRLVRSKKMEALLGC